METEWVGPSGRLFVKAFEAAKRRLKEDCEAKGEAAPIVQLDYSSVGKYDVTLGGKFGLAARYRFTREGEQFTIQEELPLSGDDDAHLRQVEEADQSVAVSWFQPTESDAVLNLDSGGFVLLEDGEPMPERYVDVVPYDGTGVLRRFVESDWTDDEERNAEAKAEWSACDGRYGPWKAHVPEATRNAFEAFQGAELEAHAADFLAEHGFRLPEG